MYDPKRDDIGNRARISTTGTGALRIVVIFYNKRGLTAQTANAGRKWVAG